LLAIPLSPTPHAITKVEQLDRGEKKKKRKNPTASIIFLVRVEKSRGFPLAPGISLLSNFSSRN